MKSAKWLIITLLGLSQYAFAAAPADAFSHKLVKKEVLPVVLLNGQNTRMAAIITVDTVNNLIKIDFYNDPCSYFSPPQPGTFRCMAMPNLVSSRTIPLVVTSNVCGSVVYQGYEDRAATDGERIEITLADHRERVCTDLQKAPAEAQVRYSSARKSFEVSYTLKAAL